LVGLLVEIKRENGHALGKEKSAVEKIALDRSPQGSIRRGIERARRTWKRIT
jgi:hypothetical protein